MKENTTSYLVLLKGGVRAWQIMGYNEGPAIVNMIPVPQKAIFSAHRAAEFSTRADAEAAIAVTEAYRGAQTEAGNTGHETIPGIEYVIVEVP
jgi:hypothetical protein